MALERNEVDSLLRPSLRRVCVVGGLLSFVFDHDRTVQLDFKLDGWETTETVALWLRQAAEAMEHRGLTRYVVGNSKGGEE